MIQMQWDERLITGVADIDIQHKEIFARFNQLLNSCEKERGHDESASVLAFLNVYTRQHFRDEERLLRDIGYPELDSHREDHYRYARRFTDIQDRYSAQGNSVQLVMKMGRLLGELLFDHIQVKDKALAEFLKYRDRRAASCCW